MLGIVINPRAGNGRGERIWKQVRQTLEERGIPYEAACTQAAGEAMRLAAWLAGERGVSKLLVIGGDGTIHEAAGGLWRARAASAAAVEAAAGTTAVHAAASGAAAANDSADAAADTAVGKKPSAAAVPNGAAASAACAGKSAANPAVWDCTLAAIPAGTGNDFAKAFGLPADPLQALELALTRGVSVPVDLLLAEDGTPSVNSFGAGFDGLVAKLTNEAGYKKLLNRLGLGSLAYLITVLRVFAGYRPCSAVLDIDGVRHELSDMWLTAAANIPFYGGSMQICPGASPHDGEVDVVVICSRSRLRLLPILASVYKGRHVGHPAVRFYRGKRVTLTTARPLYVQADGEQFGATPLCLTVVPAALSVIRSPL